MIHRRLWSNPARMQVAAETTTDTPEMGAPEWMRDSRCAQLGAADWDELEVEFQIPFCGPCPVRGECAEYGIEHLMVLDKSGTVVYGGLTPGQIAEAAKARRGEGVA